MLEDVRHTEADTTRRRTETVNLLSDEHNCHCDTQRLPDKLISYFVVESLRESRAKEKLTFNSVEIDEPKTGHYQDSHCR